jgi:hypothetical protein
MYLLHITKETISKITHMFLIILLIIIIFITSTNSIPLLHLQTYNLIEKFISSNIIIHFNKNIQVIISWLKDDYKHSQLRRSLNTYKRKVIYFLNNIK